MDSLKQPLGLVDYLRIAPNLRDNLMYEIGKITLEEEGTLKVPEGVSFEVITTEDLEKEREILINAPLHDRQSVVKSLEEMYRNKNKLIATRASSKQPQSPTK